MQIIYQLENIHARDQEIINMNNNSTTNNLNKIDKIMIQQQQKNIIESSEIIDLNENISEYKQTDIKFIYQQQKDFIESQEIIEINNINQEYISQTQLDQPNIQNGMKQHRKSITSHIYQDDQNINDFFIIRYIYDEAKFDTLFIVVYLSLLLIIQQNLNVNCSLQYTYSVCVNTYDITIRRIQQILISRIAFQIYCFYLIYGHFDENTFKIWPYILLSVVINIARLFIDVGFLINSGLNFIYGILLYLTYKGRPYHFVQRLFYPLMFSLNQILTDQIIIQNQFKLNSTLVLLVYIILILLLNKKYYKFENIIQASNFLVSCRQIVLRRYILHLLNLKIQNNLVIQFEIFFAYQIDIVQNYRIIMNSKEYPVLLMINESIMIVYVLTQFHLLVYFLEKIFFGIWDLLFKHQFNKIKDKIHFYLNILFVNFDNFWQKIRIDKYDQIKTSYEFSDCRRLIASQYLIINLWTFIYIAFILLSNNHLPYQHDETIQIYGKNNIPINGTINYLKFQLNWEKYFIKLAIFTTILIIVLIIQKKYKRKFFAYVSFAKNRKTIHVYFLISMLINQMNFMTFK